MVIKTKLTQADFINSSLVLLYTKSSTKIITGIFLLFFLIATFRTTSLRTNYFFMIIYPLIILGMNPLMTYFNARRTFANNKTNGETIEYNFDDSFLATKGETFSTEVTWSNIYKVTETDNWLLIWRNKQQANPIPKKNISEGQLKEIKRILDKNNVTNNL